MRSGNFSNCQVPIRARKSQKSLSDDNYFNAEIVAVSIDGTVQQLTFISDDEKVADFYGLSNPSLSPDGNRIAFLVSWDIDHPLDYGLVVMDLQTNTLVNTCLEKGVLAPQSLVWSSDSQLLAFVLEKDDGKELVLFDPGQGEAYLVFKMDGSGWMEIVSWE